MGRLSAPLVALALAAVLALGLSACGDSGADLLPGDTAGEINSNLDKVQALVAAGECIGAEDAAQEVSTEIDALGGVDKKLKRALREGATRLNEVVVECEEVEEEPEPSIETAVEPEAEEVEKEKPDKSKQPKPKEEAEAAPEETETTPTLPPQAEGKAKGHEKQEEEVPPVETGGGTSAGGVGPGAAVEGAE